MKFEMPSFTRPKDTKEDPKIKKKQFVVHGFTEGHIDHIYWQLAVTNYMLIAVLEQDRLTGQLVKTRKFYQTQLNLVFPLKVFHWNNFTN